MNNWTNTDHFNSAMRRLYELWNQVFEYESWVMTCHTLRQWLIMLGDWYWMWKCNNENSSLFVFCWTMLLHLLLVLPDLYLHDVWCVPLHLYLVQLCFCIKSNLYICFCSCSKCWVHWIVRYIETAAIVTMCVNNLYWSKLNLE